MRLIFDLDDTLYEQTTPFIKAFEKNIEHDDLPVLAIHKRTREISDEVFDQTESGALDVRDMHVYRLQKAFEEHGVTLSREDALQFQDDYRDNQYKIEYAPRIEDIFRYCLAHKIEIGIITNGPSEHQRSKLRQLEIERWIDDKHIVISSEVEIAKPSVEIFKRAEATFSELDTQTYYIGDSYENDVIGAKAYGWKSIWINKKEFAIPKGGVQPDYTVENYDELLEVILGL